MQVTAYHVEASHSFVLSHCKPPTIVYHPSNPSYRSIDVSSHYISTKAYRWCNDVHTGLPYSVKSERVTGTAGVLGWSRRSLAHCTTKSSMGSTKQNIRGSCCTRRSAFVRPNALYTALSDRTDASKEFAGDRNCCTRGMAGYSRCTCRFRYGRGGGIMERWNEWACSKRLTSCL